MANALYKNIGTTDTVITVVGTIIDTPNGGVIQIDSELIQFGHANVSEYLDCVRGFNSTTAASHLRNAAVTNVTSNTQAPIVEMSGAGAPTSGVTGVNLAPTGSRYTNTSNGDLYENTGTLSAPVWTKFDVGTSGITALTGDVTASGTGSVPATIASGAVTGPKLASGAAVSNIGYTPENMANKTTDGTLAAGSDTLYPSEKAVKTYVDAHSSPSFTPTKIQSFGGSPFTASSTFSDTSITTTFAMANAAHRVRVTISADGYTVNPANNIQGTIAMDGTNAGFTLSQWGGETDVGQGAIGGTIFMTWIFTPGDTAPHTFSGQYASADNASNVVFPNSHGQIIIEEII